MRAFEGAAGEGVDGEEVTWSGAVAEERAFAASLHIKRRTRCMSSPCHSFVIVPTAECF